MVAIQLGRSEFHHEQVEAHRDGAVASVQSWELVTAVDGPGTRLTYFLSGCLLRCKYCHNPDTWKMRNSALTPIGDVLARIRRYRGVFTATGGGVTLSGGEPLMLPAFVIAYALHGVHPPDAVLLERVREQFRARGLTAF